MNVPRGVWRAIKQNSPPETFTPRDSWTAICGAEAEWMLFTSKCVLEADHDGPHEQRYVRYINGNPDAQAGTVTWQ